MCFLFSSCRIFYLGITNKITLFTCLSTLNLLYKITRYKGWIAPFISVGLNNEVELEWWNMGKKLDISILNKTIEFMSLDEDNKFEEGIVDNLDYLYKWLYNK
jgi:hypothetical protein